MKEKFKPKQIVLICAMLAISLFLHAQTQTVSGDVASANGEPLAGVSVLLQGT